MKRMVQYLAVTLFVTMLVSCSALADSGVAVKGKVKKTDSYTLGDAYIQLVRLPDGEKLEIGKATAMYDISNQVIGVEYATDFPKVKLSEKGEFECKAESLEPGRYIVVAQHIIPNPKPQGYMGPGPLLTRPLARAEGKHLVIEISKEGKASFVLDLGEVVIPLDDADKFITVELKDPVFVRP